MCRSFDRKRVTAPPVVFRLDCTVLVFLKKYEGWLCLATVLNVYTREIVGRAVESLWQPMTVEEVHGCHCATGEEARRAIATYIEAFYNCERRHSSIDHFLPRQFEKQFYEQKN
jgi:transposase InsO family protein